MALLSALLNMFAICQAIRPWARLSLRGQGSAEEKIWLIIRSNYLQGILAFAVFAVVVVIVAAPSAELEARKQQEKIFVGMNRANFIAIKRSYWIRRFVKWNREIRYRERRRTKTSRSAKRMKQTKKRKKLTKEKNYSITGHKSNIFPTTWAAYLRRSTLAEFSKVKIEIQGMQTNGRMSFFSFLFFTSFGFFSFVLFSNFILLFYLARIFCYLFCRCTRTSGLAAAGSSRQLPSLALR